MPGSESASVSLSMTESEARLRLGDTGSGIHAHEHEQALDLFSGGADSIIRVLAESRTLEDAAQTLGINASTLAT